MRYFNYVTAPERIYIWRLAVIMPYAYYHTDLIIIDWIM